MNPQTSRLHQARKTLALTQEQVAVRIGITRTGYVHLERGDRTPSMATARKISALFGLPIDWLFPAPNVGQLAETGASASNFTPTRRIAQ